MTSIHRRLASLIVGLLVLSGCAVPQQHVARTLVPPKVESVYVLEESVSIQASNARATRLREGGRWTLLGEIEAGRVLSPRDQTLVVVSFNSMEADIVVADGYVVGYFLPVESAFVEVEPRPITLIPIGDSID